MGLTSAMNTSLNGLQLNEITIDVIGNNVANAGTNGFKASRTLFSTQLSRTFAVGSAPSATNGGTNPRQVGLGALNAAIQLDFNQGGITNSTSPSDLAIQGDGFFIVKTAEGNVYTRNGNFGLNSESKLTNAQGFVLQGYGVNDDFSLVNSLLTDIKVPLGDLKVAAETENAAMKGVLFSSGTVATTGGQILSPAYYDQGDVTGTTRDEAEGTTTLVNLRAVQDTGSGNTALFTAGETLTFTPRKAGGDIETQTLTITSSTTLAEFLSFMEEAYGIVENADINGNTSSSTWVPGATVTSAGQIQINGNLGTANDIEFLPAALFGSTTGTIDLGFSKTGSADGESTLSQFVVYDSLGQPINVRMTYVLESFSANETVFRFYGDSSGDSDTDIRVGNGTIRFDGNGQFVSSSDNVIQVDRATTAAITPMQVSFDFSLVSGISTSTQGSTVGLNTQDGSGPGVLTNFVIDEQGVINGVFDNGIIRTLGQIALARFANPQGLLQSGNDTYRAGVASGIPLEVAPGSLGAGTLRSGAIELSNTDIGRNLVDLIVASTQYRGNAKVISSVQQLTDELLLLNR